MKSEKGEPYGSDKPRTTSLQVGIWRVIMANGVASFNLVESFRKAKMLSPLFVRLVKEIYSISPRLFIIYVLSRSWSSIQTAFLICISNKLLKAVEAGLIDGSPNTRDIILSTLMNLLGVTLVAIVNWWNQNMISDLHMKASRHFNLLSIQTHFRSDLSLENDFYGHDNYGESPTPWMVFERTMTVFTEILTTASQLTVIVSLSRFSEGPFFALICCLRPLFSIIFSDSLWEKDFLAHNNNANYKRMKAFEEMRDPSFKADVISGNMNDYIIREYAKSQERLGEVSEEIPELQYARATWPTSTILTMLLGELPMVFCAINAVLYPTQFSVSSIASLQHTSTLLRSSLSCLVSSVNIFLNDIKTLEGFYTSIDRIKHMHDGLQTIPYPHKDSSEKGMAFDLKDVNFSYPGSQESHIALKQIAISIKPGEIVIIVGENGSGKSTLVRLLSGLYTETSGTIMIDGKPISHYRITDLRQAIAVLSQENQLLPLSLGENIGIGLPDELDADKNGRISKAATLGGALQFISKYENGMNTLLTPVESNIVISAKHEIIPGHPLHAAYSSLPKRIRLSGGEVQRIIASKTFMRFSSGKIRFVAVDEPSSALDADGELHLFENLISARKGKTMIFVTHRFGHLTRHADKIICMSNGTVAECGSHDELMAQNGQYANLYNIQARAFPSHHRSEA